MTLQIKEGKSGKSVTVKDLGKIRRLLEKLNEVEMRKKQTTEEIKGDKYTITFIDAKGKKINMTIFDDKLVKVHQQYYETIDKEVPVGEIDGYVRNGG
jgi:hypothetical protein